MQAYVDTSWVSLWDLYTPSHARITHVLSNGWKWSDHHVDFMLTLRWPDEDLFHGTEMSYGTYALVLIFDACRSDVVFEIVGRFCILPLHNLQDSISNQSPHPSWQRVEDTQVPLLRYSGHIVHLFSGSTGTISQFALFPFMRNSILSWFQLVFSQIFKIVTFIYVCFTFYNYSPCRSPVVVTPLHLYTHLAFATFVVVFVLLYIYIYISSSGDLFVLHALLIQAWTLLCRLSLCLGILCT